MHVLWKMYYCTNWYGNILLLLTWINVYKMVTCKLNPDYSYNHIHLWNKKDKKPKCVLINII